MRLDLAPPDRDRPEPLSIAPMVAADIPHICSIERRSFTTVWPADALHNELHGNKLAHYYVGKIGETIVAYGGIWVIVEDSHVTTLAVDPLYRGHRFGERIMLRLIDEAIARDAAWMTLEVRESNAVAQALYRKFGFTTVTMRRGYYSDNDESALVMWAGNLKSELYRNRLQALRERLDA